MRTLPCLVLGLALVVAAACSDDKDESAIAEVEPNDDYATATDLGGSGTHRFTGTCEDEDYYRVQSGAGTLGVTLTWDVAPAGGPDIALSIQTPGGAVLATNSG